MITLKLCLKDMVRTMTIFLIALNATDVYEYHLHALAPFFMFPIITAYFLMMSGYIYTYPTMRSQKGIGIIIPPHLYVLEEIKAGSPHGTYSGQRIGFSSEKWEHTVGLAFKDQLAISR